MVRRRLTRSGYGSRACRPPVRRHVRARRRPGTRPAATGHDHPRLARPRRGLGAGRVRPDPGAVRGVASPRACRAGARAAARAGSPPSTRCCRARRTPAPTASRSRAASAAARTRSPGWSAARCAPSSTTSALGENTIVLDCDVLQADGGTRTAAITGAYVALADAIDWARGKGLLRAGAEPLTGSVAAVSVGVVDGAAAARPVLRGGRARRDRHERRDDRRRRASSRCRAPPRASRSTGRCSTALLDLAVGGLRGARPRSSRPGARRVSVDRDRPAGAGDPQRAQGRRAAPDPRRRRPRRSSWSASTDVPRRPGRRRDAA